MRFERNMLLNAYKRMFKYIKDNDKLPPHLEIINSDNKRVKLTPRQYSGLFESFHMFILKNRRYPTFVNLISEANNPLVYDPQSTSYTCCPTSLSMASQMLYHYHSEETCSKILQTSPNSGTSPQQLIDNAPKIGLKILPIARESSEVKKYLKKGYPTIAHFQTGQTRKCKQYFISNFGHYGLIYDIKDGNYVVADPAKSVRCEYPFKCLDNANKGFRENYYVVMPL